MTSENIRAFRRTVVDLIRFWKCQEIYVFQFQTKVHAGVLQFVSELIKHPICCTSDNDKNLHWIDAKYIYTM